MIKLSELLDDHQIYHSEFQQDYMITMRSGGTQYGMYKQALRELFKRKRSLEDLYAERELLMIDIEELEQTESHDAFTTRRNTVKIKQKRGYQYDMDKNISDMEREFQRFYQQAVALKEQIGTLTPERRNELDRDMWAYKAKEMAAMDYLSSGRLSHGTIEFIGSLPIDMRETALSQIRTENQAALVKWFETKNPSAVSLPDTHTDIKLLLAD